MPDNSVSRQLSRISRDFEILARLLRFNNLRIKRLNQDLSSNTGKDKSARKGKPKQDKFKHLDIVYLTEREYEMLFAQFGAGGCKERIARLNDYIMSKGVKYKSHYHTILNWSRRDPMPITPPVPEKSPSLCREEGCEKLGIIGQGGRMWCREHDPDKIADISF